MYFGLYESFPKFYFLTRNGTCGAFWHVAKTLTVNKISFFLRGAIRYSRVMCLVLIFFSSVASFCGWLTEVYMTYVVDLVLYLAVNVLIVYFAWLVIAPKEAM